MKAAPVTELIELGRKLSPRHRQEWLSFGRCLHQQEKKPLAVEEDGDAVWERLIAGPKPRPKLDVLAAKALAEHRAGKTMRYPANYSKRTGNFRKCFWIYAA